VVDCGRSDSADELNAGQDSHEAHAAPAGPIAAIIEKRKGSVPDEKAARDEPPMASAAPGVPAVRRTSDSTMV
jgi:hypothetical protein